MAEKLILTINVDGPIAVYMQIENQIQFAIASERLRQGDILPSVRELSQMLAVNPNTVTKAYRDLELMRLVNTRRGIGVKVSAGARKLCRDKIHALTKSHLRDAVAEGIASGLSPQYVRKVVSGAINSGARPYNGQARIHT